MNILKVFKKKEIQKEEIAPATAVSSQPLNEESKNVIMEEQKQEQKQEQQMESNSENVKVVSIN